MQSDEGNSLAQRIKRDTRPLPVVQKQFELTQAVLPRQPITREDNQKNVGPRYGVGRNFLERGAETDRLCVTPQQRTRLPPHLELVIQGLMQELNESHVTSRARRHGIIKTRI